MSRVLRRVSLATRLMIIVAVALIVSSLVAEFYGAKMESSFKSTLSVQGPGAAAFMAIAAVTSSGRVAVSVEGASTAYYVVMEGGDPTVLIRQFRALNLNVTAVRARIDLRAGVAYTSASIGAGPQILNVLPLLGSVLPVESAGDSKGLVGVKLKAGNIVAIVATPESSGIVSFNVKYDVEGYRRLTVYESLAASLSLLVASILLEAARRFRTM
ncbi:MAG: hypothetical protein P3X22_002610 [Thermoprotei archaeon]|nr:hypothetical protein [Thermoprotei archaeon]